MTGCGPDMGVAFVALRRPLLFALTVGAALAGAAAMAQVAPTQLLPPPRAQAAPPPSSPAAAPEPSGGSRSGGGFRVEPLQDVSGESFGVLDGDAGLGVDLWRGTRRGQIIELLSVMPGATRSHAQNALARRILLTSATMPSADPGATGGPSMLRLRVDHLAALGDYDGLSRLIAAAPGRVTDEIAQRRSVEGQLLQRHDENACRQVRPLVGQFAEDFWAKALIFCQALGGETSQANLGAALLREKDPKGDPAFHALLRAMQGDKQVKLAKLPRPSALDLAMLNAAKLPVPADALDSDDAGVLAAIARNGATAIESRLVAGEKAEALGTLSAGELAGLYNAMKFTPKQLGGALVGSDSLGGARGRALLYVAQSGQNDVGRRAELLQRAFASSRAAGLYPTALRLYGAALESIPATDDLGWFAAEAARALYAANQPFEARTWVSAGRGFRRAGKDAVPADVAVLPYELITSERPIPWDRARWQRWKQAQGADAALKATTLLVMLEGLDRAAPDEAWDGLARVRIDPDANLPSPAVLRQLEVSAATERRGAALLGALATLGAEGPAGCHPIVLGMVIAGVRHIGLPAEARALALDAAIGVGL